MTWASCSSTPCSSHSCRNAAGAPGYTASGWGKSLAHITYSGPTCSTTMPTQSSSAADRRMRRRQPEALVHADRQTEVDAGGVERVVGGVAEVAPVEKVGTQHHADEAEVLRPLRLGHGEVDLRHGHDGCGREALRFV